ncbi:MAG: arsenic efflux protein [Bacilli bacterium]|nr:arsenic efflux protein [Bacilli bacterium]
MLDCLLDALMDTLKIIPYLFITFLLLELIEHKLTKKTQKAITKYNKFGPIIGGIFGGLPQCGFSAMASNLYTGGVITKGTLIAIFLSTSDEMLPIMLGEKVSIPLVLNIIGFKVIVGIIIGLIVDLIIKSKIDDKKIEDMCDEEHCHCKNGIFISSVIHTMKTTLFLLIANVVIGLGIYYIGENNLAKLLHSKNILVYFASSLIGLIPNCAASVILTEVYLSKLITIGTLLSGLLTGSGIGILLLFKNNKNIKENLFIISIIYFVGVIIGFLVDLFI